MSSEVATAMYTGSGIGYILMTAIMSSGCVGVSTIMTGAIQIKQECKGVNKCILKLCE